MAQIAPVDKGANVGGVHGILQTAAERGTKVFAFVLTRDRDIRPLLRSRLAALHAADARTKIVDELPICAMQARADIVVINGELAGFEIKSDVDRLDRLAGQARCYGRVFDRAAVIGAPRHLTVLRRRLPAWWGIWVVGAAVDGLRLDVDRPGEMNPEPSLRSRIALLRRDEMAEIISRRARVGTATMTRGELSSALVDLLDSNAAGAEVRRALCTRTS